LAINPSRWRARRTLRTTRCRDTKSQIQRAGAGVENKSSKEQVRLIEEVAALDHVQKCDEQQKHDCQSDHDDQGRAGCRLLLLGFLLVPLTPSNEAVQFPTLVLSFSSHLISTAVATGSLGAAVGISFSSASTPATRSLKRCSNASRLRFAVPPIQSAHWPVFWIRRLAPPKIACALRRTRMPGHTQQHYA